MSEIGNTVICVVARTVSQRLPLKVLRDVLPGLSMLEFILTRVRRFCPENRVVLCTSTEPVDDILEDVSVACDVDIYRGSALSVIDRLLAVASQHQATNVVRITGDNVLTAMEYLPSQILAVERDGLDYHRLKGVPLGATAEVMRVGALRECYGNIDPDMSEYLMLYMFRPDLFRCGYASVLPEDCSSMTLTVDTPADLERTRSILAESQAIDPLNLRLVEIVNIVRNRDLPNSVIAPSANVRTPYGSLTFQEFQDDMSDRYSRCQSQLCHPF